MLRPLRETRRALTPHDGVNDDAGCRYVAQDLPRTGRRVRTHANSTAPTLVRGRQTAADAPEVRPGRLQTIEAIWSSSQPVLLGQLVRHAVPIRPLPSPHKLDHDALMRTDLAAIEHARAFPARSLDFWFDYTCPFAYLASTQARELATRMGVPLHYQPLLLGGVFRAVQTPQNLFATRSPARASHEAADMQRWARRFGVSLTMPPSHPMRSVEALRATLAVQVDPRVVDGFFKAYWVDGREPSSEETIREVVESAGYDGNVVHEQIKLSAIKEDLRERTERAASLGIFGVPAWVVDGEHLYWGQDRMMFVEGWRSTTTQANVGFGPGSDPRPMKALHFYWDFSSPFAYLGASQIEQLALRTGAKIESHPILLGGLFKSIGTPEVPIATFSEAKQLYTLKDLHRWAEYWAVPFKFPTNFPLHSLKALRTYLALAPGRRTAFRNAVFRAGWAEDKDISNDDVLAACIGDEATARGAFARAASADVKQGLRASTEAAEARGVFGVPTFIVDDQLYWGQDRIELVESVLRS